MVKLENSETTKCWLEFTETGLLWNGTATLANTLVVPTKTKRPQKLNTWPSHCSPGHYSREMKTSVWMETLMCVFIASLFMINRNWKLRVSFKGWVVTNPRVHPYYGILRSSTKAQPADTCCYLSTSPEDYALWKQANPKGFILCESIYITFFKRQNHRTENRSVVARRQGGRRWVWL